MIYRVYSDNPNFREVSFSQGLNIIVSEKELSSNKKDSRNGVGKSTLIKIIDFCFGSKYLYKNNKFLEDKVNDWIFFLEFDLSKQKVTCSRSLKNKSKVYIEKCDFSQFAILPKKDEKGFFYNIKDWISLLGKHFFDLFEEEDSDLDKKPSFRSIISYFIRDEKDAFTSPFSFYSKKTAISNNINNAFLLGIDWKCLSKLEKINKKKKDLDFKKKFVQGMIWQYDENLKKGKLENNIAKIRDYKVKIEDEYNKLKKDIDSFIVHEHYEKVEKEANDLTNKIKDLASDNFSKETTLSNYKKALEKEKFPDEEFIEKIYEESNFFFPKKVVKELEELREFHNKIIRNRKQFLEKEIVYIKNAIKENNKLKKIYSDDRKEKMEILQKCGALEDFNKLNNNALKTKGKVFELNSIIKHYNDFQDDKNTQDNMENEIKPELSKNYDREYTNIIREFAENSEFLYNKKGSLIISNTKSEEKRFQIEIERDGSKGVENMKIFCYDFTFFSLGNKRNFFDTLIHDSAVFDGVDSRQIANALELADKKCDENNLQYICAINSNNIPKNDFSEKFIFEDKVVITLKDKLPEDSILGFRF